MVSKSGPLTPSNDKPAISPVNYSEVGCTTKKITATVAALAIFGGGCVILNPLVVVTIVAVPLFGIGMYRFKKYEAKKRLETEKEISELIEKINKLKLASGKKKEDANAAGTGQEVSGKTSASASDKTAKDHNLNLKKSEEAAKASAAAKSAADAKAAQEAKELLGAKPQAAKPPIPTPIPKGKEKVQFPEDHSIPPGQAGPAASRKAGAAGPTPPKSFPNKGLPNRGSDCFLNSCMQMIMRVETFKNALLILDDGNELRLFGDFIRKYERGEEIKPLDVFALRVLLFKISLNKKDQIIDDFLNKYKSNSLQQIDMDNLRKSELYKPQKESDGRVRDDIFFIDKQHDAIEVFKLLAGKLNAKLPIFRNETETLYVDIPAADIQYFERSRNSQKKWGDIELDINQQATLVELINNYFDEYYDPNEKTLIDNLGRQVQVRHSQKRFDINPQDFYITLKRFGGITGKNIKAVIIPNEIEIPNPLGDEYPKERYELDSFIIHIGARASFGHYIYYHYDKSSKTWIEFDDSNVSFKTDGEINEIKKNAYMYHYLKVNS